MSGHVGFLERSSNDKGDAGVAASSDSLIGDAPRRRTFSPLPLLVFLSASRAYPPLLFPSPSAPPPGRLGASSTLRFNRHFVPRCADERDELFDAARTGGGDGGERSLDISGAVHASVHAGL